VTQKRGRRTDPGVVFPGLPERGYRRRTMFFGFPRPTQCFGFPLPFGGGFDTR